MMNSTGGKPDFSAIVAAGSKRQRSSRGLGGSRKRSRKDDDVLQTPQAPPIDDEMMSFTDAILRRPRNEVVVSISRQRVRVSDLETLGGRCWLNDSIVNAYLGLIVAHGQHKKLRRVYAFNSFFYERYATAGYSAVQRWTKDVDIFDHHLLLVPVHLPGHWCMAVIDFRGKQIRYMDSLGGRNDRCLRGLLEYLVQEMQTRKDCRFETEGWSLETVENIPRQTNNFDCGVFALKFADYAARDLEVNFSQSDMLYFRQRMLFEIAHGKMLGTGYGNVWHC